MGIGIHRRLGIGVTQSFLDDLRMDPGLDEQGRMRVSQFMHRDFGDICRLYGQAVTSPQTGIPDIGAPYTEADEVLVVAPPEFDHVILLTKSRLLEEADQLVGDGDDPDLFPLGLLERISALRLDGGSDDCDLFTFEVNI